MKAKGRQKRGRNRVGPLRASLQLSIRLFICAFAVLQIQHPNLVVNGQDQAAADTTAPIAKPDTGEKKPVNADKVKEYIEHHKTQDMTEFTYEQLEAWFLNRSETYRFQPYDYPRAFPFCITRKHIIQGHKKDHEKDPEYPESPDMRVTSESNLYKFERYFHGVELRRKKFYQFEPEEDSTIYNKTFVKSIELSRINTPEQDMVNLRQWVHITVTMAEPMVGLYMQSIVGPFGLPFGEFSVDFPCRDLTASHDIAAVGELAYCSYRPKTNIYHPSAYVGFSKDVDKENSQIQTVYKGKREFHLHFKWFDLACMETPYVQFLMLIVKKETQNPRYGIDYVAQMSPVYLNINFDSMDGSPYPFYPGFIDPENSRMFCNIKDHKTLIAKYKEIGLEISKKDKADWLYKEIFWDEAKNITRIQPNEEYDDCIVYDRPANKTSGTYNPQEEYECNPGPFNCDVDFKSGKDEASIKKERTNLVAKETDLSKCFPCGVPECVRLGFLPEYCDVELPPVNDLLAETNVLTELDDNTRVRAHGVSGMLAFLFFIPIAHFVGRFYKEVMGKCLFGNGPWIFVHLMCSMLAIAAIWTSMGPMIPTLAAIRERRMVCKQIYNSSKHAGYEKCLEGYHIKSPHTVSGLIAYLLVHLVPIFGFIRPPSNKLRFIMSAVHSHLGYFTYFLGVGSIFLAIREPRCVDTLVFCIMLVVLPVLFSVVAFFLDLMSDKRLGVKPGRKQWPVLEQLQLESRGPLEFPKLIVLIIFILLMGLVWLLALISLHIVEDSGDKLLEGVNDFKGNKAKYLGKLQGLFGECGAQTETNETTD